MFFNNRHSSNSAAGPIFETLEGRTLLSHGLTGEYFSGSTFLNPLVMRTDPTIDFNWPTGLPDPALQAGRFSARWTGQITIAKTGRYSFYTPSDAFTRLIVNGRTISDRVSAPAERQKKGTLLLRGGRKYSIQLQYVGRQDQADSLSLLWSAAGISKQVVPADVLTPDPSASLPPSHGFTGIYYKDTSLHSVLETRRDSMINFSGPTGRPGAALATSPIYSAAWQGLIEPKISGDYTFAVETNGGVRLSVNGVKLIEKWSNTIGTSFSGTLPLVAGQRYALKLIFHRTTRAASEINLKWSPPNQAAQPIPQGDIFNAGKPLSPAHLLATTVSSSAVDLHWSDVPVEDGFVVQRSINGGMTWQRVSVPAKGNTAFSDTQLSAATSYQYRVQSTNAGDGSAFGAPVAAVTTPDAPADLTATVTSSAIDLAWHSVAGAKGYTIQRSLDGLGNWTTIGKTSTAIVCSNRHLASGATFYYRVLATNGGGSSAPSNTLTAQTAPTAPATGPGTRTLPGWMSSDSQALWDAKTKTLTVTGNATLLADPGTDLPNITANSSASNLTFGSGSDAGTVFHIAGLSLTNGASAALRSLGAARTAANYNLLVVGVANPAIAPTFAIDAASGLDLADNDLIVLYGSGVTPFSSIRTDLSHSYDGGAWDQPGITSSAARSDPTHYAQGYGEASVLGLTTFDGITLGANAVIVKYTLNGDSDLNGVVDGADYNKLIGHLNTPGDWTDGNSHYGPTIDGSDYNDILANINTSLFP